MVVVDSDVSGDVNYELSYTPYKPLMIALMQNDTTRSIAITAATANGTGSIVGKAGIETTIAVGDVFSLSSVADSALDGTYTCIDNTTTADEIIVYPELPAATVPATALDVVITADTIISNGSDTFKTFTFKKTVTESATPYYWYYRGCSINTMNFNFATGSILGGSLGIIGLTEEATTTAITGQSDVDVASYAIMNSVSSVGTIYLEGVSLGTCSFSSLDISVDNQINAAKSIGVLGACDLAAFSLQVTANSETFFKDLTLYSKFNDAAAFSITLILKDSDGNSIGISLPKCKFETLDTPISGKDSFLMQSGTIRALRDTVNDEMIKLSFIDAV